MSIGITDEHVELASSLRKWAASLGPIEAARAADGRADERFDDIWAAAEEMGVAAIAVPESAGGGGGTLLEQAIALEACAYELVPGGLLGAAIGAIVALLQDCTIRVERASEQEETKAQVSSVKSQA